MSQYPQYPQYPPPYSPTPPGYGGYAPQSPDQLLAPARRAGVLMIVLGIQIIALGLIGEIVIFASGRRIKDYTVEKIV